MKKIWMMMAMVAIFTACSSEEELDFLVGNYTLTGYADVESRTAFGAPGSNSIPFEWSIGDKIWAGTTQSYAIATGGKSATFTFASEPTGTVYYNMTGSSAQAEVHALQSIGDLGTNGDFGYGTITNGSFTLSHATAYLWFNVTSTISEAKLETIKVNADRSYIAGKAYWNGSSFDTVTDGSDIIELTVGETLTTTNNNVWAMVVLPANLQGKTVKVTYKLTVNNATKYYTQTLSGKNLPSGTTQKITANIANNDLTDYAELRVLTFEDKDVKFEPYELEYGEYWEIRKWSDLIDKQQQNGDLLYDASYCTPYTWWDENNTNIKHIFTDSYGMSSFAGGGHAISNYMEPEYAPEYLQTYLDKYYEDPLEYWGWQFLQLMTPIGAHSGSNFAVHFGYLDDSGYGMCSDLPSFEFTDCPHIIDHMYVTNTNYMLNQTVYGVSREDDDNGDQFGGNYNGISEDSWLKIVAYGFESIDDEEPTSEVEFYLLKDKTVVLDWQKWDLTELGMVEKVKFNFLYSEDVGGLYGFTIPAYFAYDDVAVRF